MKTEEYDIQVVADTIGLDKDTMLMLLEEFLNVLDEEIILLANAVSDGDADMVTHVAHKMKGAAANMMVEDLRKYSCDLQSADKADTDLVADLLGKIQKSYSAFRALFRS
ncbi:MAG: hypothetical protein C0603_10415 [Denitrovibrio sp.]|nr:MAG: hypothetical protein C0603_10415 [Denitrovibrio sp.]